MDRELLERLLREPDNLFGPPTGHGYDYVGAALTVLALALGVLSGWCLLAPTFYPGLHPALVVPLLIIGAPFCLGVWFLWPAHLLVGWVGAVVVWYATLRSVADLSRVRPCGRGARVGWALCAAVGWAIGIGLAFAWWL